MNIWPLKFRVTDDSRIFFANDSGSFFISDEAFLHRYATNLLDESDVRFLCEHGHTYDQERDLSFTAFAFNWVRRLHVQEHPSYLMLVPTLRCNQSCTYCQVSRAAESAVGYDWSEETLGSVLKFIGDIEGEEIKVEFQGGEPLLRVDLLECVRDFCRSHFKRTEFVVCTNMQKVESQAWAFLEADDTYVSTSIDGDLETHNLQRSQNYELAIQCFSNIEEAVRRLGSSHVSALPTIDVERPPDLNVLIETFERFGIHCIYLRPINYQGFARQKTRSQDNLKQWNTLHSDFIELLIERNFHSEQVIEEFYFSHCLRRMLRHGIENHVNIRNPNLLGTDYLVIDYDGTLYPTDESRMLQRIGQIDLSIGAVADGIDHEKVAELNASSFNNFDPDCIHCPYQPFCGTDVVDDISRYGRIDLPRLHTWFCGRQLALFDKAVSLMYRRDTKTKHSLAQWSEISSWPEELAPEHS